MSNEKISFTPSELYSVIATYLRGYATLDCPCGFKTFPDDSQKEWEEHLKHRFQFGTRFRPSSKGTEGSSPIKYGERKSVATKSRYKKVK